MILPHPNQKHQHSRPSTVSLSLFFRFSPSSDSYAELSTTVNRMPYSMIEPPAQSLHPPARLHDRYSINLTASLQSSVLSTLYAGVVPRRERERDRQRKTMHRNLPNGSTKKERNGGQLTSTSRTVTPLMIAVVVFCFRTLSKNRKERVGGRGRQKVEPRKFATHTTRTTRGGGEVWILCGRVFA